jgi:hypothetical protein
MRKVITPAHLDYIRANYLMQTDAQIAKALGCEKSAIQRNRKKLGLDVSNEEKCRRRAEGHRGRTTCSPDHDQILKDNYLTVAKSVLAKLIGRSETLVVCRLRQLGLVIPQEILDQRKADSRIKKGSIPPNKGKKIREFLSPEAIAGMSKTQFKPGTVPPNHKPVGYERINVDGYVELKVTEGVRGFRLKHRVVWEQHNGAIPRGSNIQFKDCNPLNCDIGNLYLISRKEQMKQNSYHNWPKELALNVQLRGALNRQINKRIKQLKNEKQD